MGCCGCSDNVLACSSCVRYDVFMQTALTFAQNPALPALKDRLVRAYPAPAPRARGDALRQLVYMLIARGAAASVGLAVFNRVRTAYPNWEALRRAAPNDLARLFIGLPRARAKAVEIPAVLETIAHRCGGECDLSLLSRMTTDAARRWLEDLPGVDGPLASAVLTFSSLRRASLPIDRTAARPVRRLGLCPDGAPLSALERHVAEAAPADWRSDDFAAFSAALHRLAHTVCGAGRPECDKCPVANLCPSAGRMPAEVLPFPGVTEWAGQRQTTDIAKSAASGAPR